MKVEIRRIVPSPSPFCIQNGELVWEGSFFKRTDRLVQITGQLKGQIELSCDRCGEMFAQELEEELELIASDGFFQRDDDNEENEFVIELMDGVLDLDDLMQGEIELVRSDYHVCGHCTDMDS